jgi:hypothetical protein
LEIFFSNLKPKHFDKQMEREKPPHSDYIGDIPVMLDVYKSKDILGQKAYTHFYFDDGQLMIDSVHESD